MAELWGDYNAVNIIYLRRVNKELDMECERAERYKNQAREIEGVL